MDQQVLINTVTRLFADHKGLLAMDESTGTCNKRFAAEGIPQTVEMRRKYRELLVTTPGLHESISGAILFDETIRQQTADGTPYIKILMDAGIIPGIKVDMGAKPLAGFPGEKVTEGLVGLRERLVEYREMGARFAKWRAVLNIGDGMPSPACVEANAHALARYAAVCQEEGLVPIVEPEVMMTGTHSLESCFNATSKVLHTVFDQLFKQHVFLEGMLLKPNMILPGLNSGAKASRLEIATATLKCLLRSVPAAVPGVVFLSGGQTAEEATERLNEMNAQCTSKPWSLSFSFGRALQQPALAIWNGDDNNIVAAQKALYHRAKCNRAACKGAYNATLEHTQ